MLSYQSNDILVRARHQFDGRRRFAGSLITIHTERSIVSIQRLSQIIAPNGISTRTSAGRRWSRRRAPTDRLRSMHFGRDTELFRGRWWKGRAAVDFTVLRWRGQACSPPRYRPTGPYRRLLTVNYTNVSLSTDGRDVSYAVHCRHDGYIM